MARKKGSKLEEYRRKKADEERKRREKEYKKASKIQKKVNRPMSKPQPFKGEFISPMDDVDFVRENRQTKKKPVKGGNPTVRKNRQPAKKKSARPVQKAPVKKTKFERDFFDTREIGVTKRKPLFAQKKKKSSNIIHHDFLGNNVKGSGVYEKREYIDSRTIKKSQGKKKKGVSRKARLRMKILAYVMIVAVVLVAGLTLSLTVFFKTEAFKVIGDTQYSTEEIINASGIALGENIFLADKETASQNIVNAFPYVEQADVSFSMPDTITIKITEGKPGYTVKYGDKQFCVVSTEGRILDNVNKKQKGLPVIKGIKLKSSAPGSYVEYDNEKNSETLQEIVESIDKCNFNKLSAIDVSNNRNINFTYDGRILVKIGMPEDIDYKIRTAKVIITERLDPNNTGVIEGTLDVSSCNETKRSYFDEKSIGLGNEKKSSTEPTTAVESGYADNGYTDSGYADNGYADNGYADNGYADNGYADNGYTDNGYADNGYAVNGYVDNGYADNGAYTDYGAYTGDGVVQ